MKRSKIQKNVLLIWRFTVSRYGASIDITCPKNNEIIVRKGAELFYKDFERGGTDTWKERADSAWIIYRVMMWIDGEKDVF